MKALLTFIFLFFVSAIASDSTLINELTVKAEVGETEAQYQLGLKHLKMFNYLTDKYDEIAKENFEAEKWFHRAAEQGHVLAQYELGKLYFPDDEHLYGFTEDIWRTREHARKNVHPDSLESVGGEYGIPYEMNSEKWLLKAAEKGLPEAQYSLAVLYMLGYGRHGNYLVAINWLEKAAQQDHTPAQRELGQTYAVPNKEIMNMARAYFWLKIASDEKDNYSNSLLKNVEMDITQNQLIEAQKLLDDWYKRKE